MPTKPTGKFTRESFMLSERKPTRAALGTLANGHSQQMTAILAQLDAKFKKYLDSKGAVIVKLDKALYGCVESAVLSNKDLRATLEEDGHIVNHYDTCVFNEIYEGKQITVIFHVDNLLAA